MAISDKNGKTIRRVAIQVINHVCRLCQQKAVERSLIVPIYGADKRTEKCCGVSDNTKFIRREMKEALCPAQERQISITWKARNY